MNIMIPLLAPILTRWWPNGALRTVKLAARHHMAAALDTRPPLGERPKGLYLYGSRLEEMSEEAKDVKKQRMLWSESIVYTQLKEGETILRNWS